VVTRKSFIIVISTFGIYILGMIGMVVLAKLWGEESVAALGTIGFAISTASIFSIFSTFGFSVAHVKRISEGNDLGTCIGTFITIQLCLIGVMLGAIFVWTSILNPSFTDATTESVFTIAIIYVVFTNLKNIPLNTFTGLCQITKRQITLTFENVTKLPLMILVALFATGVTISSVFQPLQQFVSEHAVGSLAMVYVAGVASTFIVGMYLMRNYPIKRPRFTMLKSYFIFAVPLAFSSVLIILSMHIDKVMIGYFWTSTEVGYYFVVQRITSMLAIFPAAVGIVLFPTISRFFMNNEIESIRINVRLSERYISMIMIPPVIFTIVFSSSLIEILLDSAYLPGVTALIILSIWILINGLSMPYTNLIVGMDKPKSQATIAIVACLINIALNYLMVPKNGMLSSFGVSGPSGAACATVISGVYLFVASRIVAFRLAKLNPWQSHTVRHILAGIVMGLSLYQMSSYISMHWLYLSAFAGVGLLIYISVLYVLKEFNKKDLDFYLDILHPKKMLIELKGDFKNGT